MKDKTAVEFLVDNIHYLHSTKWQEIVEQAKQMEKQQMIEFGKKMQIVKDITPDGDIEFCFEPKKYIEKNYE